MNKNLNMRMRARKSKITKTSHGRFVSSRADEKPYFDKEVDHLPKAAIEQQVERLMRENKQALDALSKL